MNNKTIIEIPDIDELSEKVCIFTALGLSFWDPVLNMQISDHLCVRAWQDKTNYPVKYAFRTASGNYAFQKLPGLHGIEYPKDKENLPASKKYNVEVKDELNRFMPVVFSVELPLPYRGLYLSENLKAFPGFCLISSPSRTTQPGFAYVRGRLICKSTDLPASYAVVEVEIEGRKWYGISDKNGIITVIFPYPQFKSLNNIINPQDKMENPFSLQTWQMTIRIQFSPESLVFPHGSKIPLLQTIVTQKAGKIWETESQSVEELSSKVTFDQEFILRTEDKYLFSWDEIPGNDSLRLINFLNQKYSIDWVKIAEIKKFDEVKTIKLSTEINYLSLKLNNEKTEVSLKIDDLRTGKFIVKMEDGKLNIYDRFSDLKIDRAA